MPIDSADTISDPDTRGIGRRTGDHCFDVRAQILERGNKKWGSSREPSGKNEIRQDEVKSGSGGDDQDLAPQSLVCKRSRTVLLCGRLGFIFTEQLDVTAEWNGRKEIFCFAHCATEELRSESKGKFENLNADPASGQEVPEFMERDQHAQNNQEPPCLL